jgi:hypothetical protein
MDIFLQKVLKKMTAQILYLLCWIWGFHSGDYKDLLDCNAV